MIAEPTLERVQAVVAGVAGAHRTPADVGPDTPLAAGGFWLDSVHLLEALMACEETFGIEFDPETDFTDATLRTVGTLHELVRSKRPR